MSLSYKDYAGNRAGKELAQFRKAFPLMVTRALQQTILEWQEIKAPGRFNRQGFHKYDELKDSYKRKYTKGRKKYKNHQLQLLVKRIEKGEDTPEPMTKSGALKTQFLNGSIRFTGGKRTGNVTAIWTTLPSKPFSRKTGQINVAEALTDIPERELDWFKKTFDKYLQQNIDKNETGILGGVAVINI